MKIVKAIIALLPLAITAAVLPMMPESVPMHYNIEGSVDRMGSRYELLLMPIMIILVVAVSSLAMKHYEKRADGPDDDSDAKAARTNIKTLNIMSLVTPALFGVLQIGLLYMTYRNSKAQNVAVNSEMIVRMTVILIGIMCIVFGSIMPRTEKNNIFGFRTTWSMFNDNTWSKCNRLGGIVFIIIGMMMIISAAFVPATLVLLLMIGYLVAGTAVMMVYSYRVYKEETAGRNQ